MADALPVDTRKKSVTLDEQKLMQYNFYMMPFMQTAPLTALPPEPPVYWTYNRDIVLRATTLAETMWGSAVGISVTKMQSAGWSVEGSPRKTKQAHELLSGVNFLRGWRYFIAQHGFDFLCTDNGAFVEIIRATSGAGSKIMGLAHLDSLRCRRTGDDEVPVVYRDYVGIEHELKWHQVFSVVDMPSPSATMRGVGFCAASRAYSTIYKLANIEKYISEKASGRRPLELIFVSNLSQKQIDGSLQGAQLVADQQGLTTYMGAAIVATQSDLKPEVVTVKLAEIPDRVDVDKERQDAYLRYADAIGLDPQELQPLTGRAMGTATQSQVLDDKEHGKFGWFQSFAEQLNLRGIVGNATTFAFSEKDWRDQQAEAQVRLTRAQTRQAQIASGEITAQQSQQMAADVGDIPKEFVPAPLTQIETVQDTDNPDLQGDSAADASLGGVPPAQPGVIDPNAQMPPATLPQVQQAVSTAFAPKVGTKGSASSGNFDHSGREGEVGGSGEGGQPVGNNVLKNLMFKGTIKDRGAIKAKGAKELAAKAGIQERYANNILASWANMSNDSGGYQDAMQQAGAELDSWKSMDVSKGMETVVRDEGGDSARAEERQNIYKAQYDRTQEYLAGLGWGEDDFVTMYRGIGYDKVKEGGVLGYHTTKIEAGDKVRVHARPLSSWTMNVDIAKGFLGIGSHHVIIQAQIPRKAIFASWHTGFGCANEQEYVIKGKYTTNAIVHTAIHDKKVKERSTVDLTTISPKRAELIDSNEPSMGESMYLEKVADELDEYGRILVLAAQDECPQSGTSGESGKLRDSIRHLVEGRGSPDIQLRVYAGSPERPEVVVRSSLYGRRGFGPKDPKGYLVFPGSDGELVYTKHVGPAVSNNWFERAWDNTADQRNSMARRIGALAKDQIKVTGVKRANAEHIDGFNPDKPDTIKAAIVKELGIIFKGGEGSGNFDHSGREGEVGGSGEGSGSGINDTAPEISDATYNKIEWHASTIGRQALKEAGEKALGAALVAQGIPSSRGRTLLSDWADSSNDSGSMSDYLQVEAGRQDGWADMQESGGMKTANAEKNSMSQAAAKVAYKDIYARTQQALTEAGVKDGEMITLYRGVHFDKKMSESGISGASSFPQESELVNVKSRPLSSWTTAPTVAEDFAREGNRGVVLKVKVPKEAVFAHWSTGLGCASEQEFILKGKYTQQARIRRTF